MIMNPDVDYAVVGGGVVGLAAALGLAKRGIRTAIIDSGSLAIDLNNRNIRAYAVNAASQALLTSLGVWGKIHASCLSPYQRMHVWDEANNACIDFDARMIATNKLGYIVEEYVLKNALLETLLALDPITVYPHQKVKRLTQHQNGLALNTEQHDIHAGSVVIADGAHSPCRDMLEIKQTTWPYHQHAVVCTVNTQEHHQNTAWQVFNADGSLAFLPLPDSNECSIVWSTTPSKANQLINADDATFNEQLTQAFTAKLGNVSVCSPRYQFPLMMRHTHQYVGDQWVLLGDAAHTIHPLAGLGLNLGLADVAAWLKCLDKSPTPLHPSPKHLAAFQRHRKHAVWQSILLMQGFKSLFINPLKPVKVLRGLGLNVCNQLTPLKRLFIAHANVSF